VRGLRKGHYYDEYGSALRKVLCSPDSNWAVATDLGLDAEAYLVAFDLQAGRWLQLDTYGASTSEGAMGWTKSGRLVVAIWSDYFDQERRTPQVFVYDLRTMTKRYGLGSPVRFEVTR
jgi:hypothetical protein